MNFSRDRGAGLFIGERSYLGSMRRALLFFALIFSLALSPIGALAHAYQHHDGRKSDPSHGKHESGAPSCGLCTAFSALEHASSGLQTLVVCVGIAAHASTKGASALAARHFVHFLQRAPPAIL